MDKELCTFHHRHGLNIRLLKDKTVAHRVDSYNNGVVFTEQPIPNGCIFQIEVISQNDKSYPGSLVSCHDVKYLMFLFRNRELG